MTLGVEDHFELKPGGLLTQPPRRLFQPSRVVGFATAMTGD
jgi:hypothetical protein